MAKILDAPLGLNIRDRVEVANFSPLTESANQPNFQLADFPSKLFTVGSEAANDSSWILSSKPPEKNCYYCKGTGKCMHDTPEYSGSGKDPYGEKEYQCGGSGLCQKCDGDGILY